METKEQKIERIKNKLRELSGEKISNEISDMKNSVELLTKTLILKEQKTENDKSLSDGIESIKAIVLSLDTLNDRIGIVFEKQTPIERLPEILEKQGNFVEKLNNNIKLLNTTIQSLPINKDEDKSIGELPNILQVQIKELRNIKKGADILSNTINTLGEFESEIKKLREVQEKIIDKQKNQKVKIDWENIPKELKIINELFDKSIDKIIPVKEEIPITVDMILERNLWKKITIKYPNETIGVKIDRNKNDIITNLIFIKE